MKAAVWEGSTPTLTVEEIPRPTPRRGEILLKVTACGVCHTDLHVLKSEVNFPAPAVLGHEVSGVVEELGDGVDTLAVGDRVVCSFIMPCGECRHCARGLDDLCEKFFAHNRLKGTLYDGETRLARADGTPLAMYSMGGLAEYCVVPASDAFVVPDGVGLGEVSILGCSSFTALGAVTNAELRLADRIAVVAAGGVGSSIVQFAAAAGVAQIIAIDVNDDKLKAVAELGATHTVNSRDTDVVAEVRALTDGHGVDVAFEALGHPSTFATALDILDDGGRAVVVGIAPAGTPGELDLARLVRRSLQIRGSYGAKARRDMPALLRMVAGGIVEPERVITRRYRLDEVDEAYQALARGEIVGRAIIEMDSE
ncbi:zinc-binding dehydrogenase [Gordonia sp. JH63]|jgi:S-(hydroxymethyl)glutathione dehydrogenase/alcohol dehydrogenase|uniref:zinc-binding dehydrogenase n=1 Tax=Gordonia TaxID=2053 RepID=UPI00083AD9B8|nr:MULTISPECIES: zinc-binding dehydrogenase [unclassified Gordonia (in: high G+C Gram-positive bacteria)]MBR7194811.1 zinc-binding dehydrogenase [Gordonia sp. SCSIO 19800]OCW84729.1 alcohol dehydrogenase [Nocardia farcinica]QHD87753.1 zinc-binding dehydrogenase [Gordonia sp. JH63]